MSTTWHRFVGTAGMTMGALATCSLLGCKTATLSAGGAQVATSQSAPVDQGYPPSACRSLGYVVGRGGGAFGGAWVSNEKLVKYAMNDLQNKVAALGGNFVQHDSPQLGMAGDQNGSSTTTATVSGTAYACDLSARGRAAPAPAAPATVAAPALMTAPEGAGGFKFGTSAAEAQKECAAAGHAWKRAGDDGECSETLVPVGAPARVVVHLCAEVACGVDLVMSESLGQIVAKYDDLYAALQKKYGIPRQHRAPIDPVCANSLSVCLGSQNAPAGAAWSWPDGNKIELRLALSAGAPVVQATYANPARTKSTTPGPAL